ncbi:MAG: hypothetical protein ABH856_02790 [Patescibacteria group bacterium]|nr:hypothetical protein [Patescibacteria group bacterium]
MTAKSLQAHPFLLFWIGILTGALIVGILFLYRLYAPETGGASLFRGYYPTSGYTQNLGTSAKGIIDPTPWQPTAGRSIIDPTPW